MKITSGPQSREVIGRFATQVGWDQLDGDKLQNEVINLSTEEFGRRFTKFLVSGARFILGGLKVATAPFDMAGLLGQGWAFWKGPKEGEGKEGEEERNKTSLALTEVDFAKSDFVTCLKAGEPSITGEEKLVRLAEEQVKGRIIYGATVFMGLYLDWKANGDKGCILEKLHQSGIIGNYVDFPGDVLRNPNGNRYVLYFYRYDDGQWIWNYDWLGNVWREQGLSAVSQQVSSSPLT